MVKVAMIQIRVISVEGFSNGLRQGQLSLPGFRNPTLTEYAGRYSGYGPHFLQPGDGGVVLYCIVM